jgi:flagellar basal body-associated protein FliL
MKKHYNIKIRTFPISVAIIIIVIIIIILFYCAGSFLFFRKSNKNTPMETEPMETVPREPEPREPEPQPSTHSHSRYIRASFDTIASE